MADGARGRMPAQKPGKSRQDYGTPPKLLEAVERRFGPIAWDLAATAENSVGKEGFFGEGLDSLATIAWASLSGLLWLNPPFSKIKPWAEKCVREAEEGARILLLTPAAVGSEWFREIVQPHAYSMFLAPRLTFLGEKTPYPKDCMLSLFYAGVRGSETWRWDGKRA